MTHTCTCTVPDSVIIIAQRVCYCRQYTYGVVRPHQCSISLVYIYTVGLDYPEQLWFPLNEIHLTCILLQAFTLDFRVHWGSHPLRPEFIESTYFLYKVSLTASLLGSPSFAHALLVDDDLCTHSQFFKKLQFDIFALYISSKVTREHVYLS